MDTSSLSIYETSIAYCVNIHYKGKYVLQKSGGTRMFRFRFEFDSFSTNISKLCQNFEL